MVEDAALAYTAWRPDRISGRSPFPPIADYAFLSDCETNCLIAPSGAVEWMCLPRPDSPSIFTALLGTPGDEPADWVRAGQALQRLWLEVTTAGLHASLLNQPLEHPRLRSALLALAPGAGAAAQVLLRMGHGEPVPPTPRRPLSELRLRTG